MSPRSTHPSSARADLGLSLAIEGVAGNLSDLTAVVESRNPHSNMKWRGVWNPAALYLADDVTRDGLWLTVALNPTQERPAPQPSGPPSYDLPDVPAWETETFLGSVASGHIYEVLESGWATDIDVWVPADIGAIYRILVTDITNPLVPRDLWSERGPFAPDQWVTLASLGWPVRPGARVSVILESLNTSSSTIVDGEWTRAVNDNGVANDPGDGNWGTTNVNASIRISKLDDQGADRSATLASLITGTLITMTDALNPNLSNAWTLQGPGVDQGTHWSYADVLYEGPGISGGTIIGNLCDVEFIIPVPAETAYVRLTDWWLANQPSWASVEGSLALDGVPQPATDDAFGIRIQFQPGFVSGDWALLAYSSAVHKTA